MTEEQLACASKYANELLSYGESAKETYFGAISMLETLGIRFEIANGEHVLYDTEKPSI